MSCKPRLLLPKSLFVCLMASYIWSYCEIQFMFWIQILPSCFRLSLTIFGNKIQEIWQIKFLVSKFWWQNLEQDPWIWTSIFSYFIHHVLTKISMWSMWSMITMSTMLSMIFEYEAYEPSEIYGVCEVYEAGEKWLPCEEWLPCKACDGFCACDQCLWKYVKYDELSILSMSSTWSMRIMRCMILQRKKVNKFGIVRKVSLALIVLN